MATQTELLEYVATELGVDAETIKFTFVDGVVTIIVNGVDEDALDEDEGFDDGDDE
jgi:hypothetical protein